jgi:hypothetical protein
MRPKKTTLTHQQQLEILKSAYPNMQSAGSDHWVDTESASITFVGSLPEGNIREPDDQSFEQNNPVEIVARCCLNSITSKIIDELKICYLYAEVSLNPEDVASLIELDEDAEKVDWISSTWIWPMAVNLYVCTVKGMPNNVFATEHSDGGVLININGPWKSVDDAKASYGFVEEGWTDS